MSYKNSEEVKKKMMEETLENIEQRNHVFVEGTYENRESYLVIWCPTHGNEHTTTFSNYNRSRTGCPCCGKQQVSNKLTGRQFSEVTLEKMRIANNQRPNRGGKPRRWREDQNYRNWRNAVFEACNYECVITGVKKQKTGDLIVHHLYSAKENVARKRPRLIYVPENGIVLKKYLHQAFHEIFKYGNNTLDQFRDFLHLLECNLPTGEDKISIQTSSQANLKGLEGLETRAYDPDRVKKLHEHLGRVKPFLKSLSTSPS